MALEIPQNQTADYRPINRLAMLVVHSNPLAEPGAGDAGGMTVYVRQVAKSLAAQGIDVDIYTRRDLTGGPAESQLYPGVKVIQIEAGDPSIPKEQIPAHIPAFASNLVKAIEARFGSKIDLSPAAALPVSAYRAAGPGYSAEPVYPAVPLGDTLGDVPPVYDMVHSHYWLSGKVASLLQARFGTPFIHTFHTLGLVKNRARRLGDPAEPELRLRGEAKVIAEACAIVASTAEERESLIDLYAAHPERIHLIPPGVDHGVFRPAARDAAKRRMGLEGKKVLLFVGRLQPLKAADTAIRALSHLITWGKVELGQVRMLIVGGSSGVSGLGEASRLERLAAELGVCEAIDFIPAQPQHVLPRFYQAADVCLVPSRAESFGLVALEALASGVPVVGSSVGGLRSIIWDGHTGFLVEPASSEAFADRAWRILANPAMGAAMGRLGVQASEQFSWDRSAEELQQLYSASTKKEDCGSVSS